MLENRKRTAIVHPNPLGQPAKIMLDSVRVRLTVWYSAVLALALLTLASVTYLLLTRNAVQSADSNLSELAAAFLTTVDAELESDTSLPGLVQAAKEAIEEHRFRDYAFVVLGPDERIVITSEDSLTKENPRREFPRRVFASESFQKLVHSAQQRPRPFGNVEGGKDGYRGVVRRFPVGNAEFTLVVLQSLHRQQEMFEGIVRTFAVVVPLGVILATAGGYFLAKKSLAPVVAMSTQAGKISASNLHERLMIRNESDELGHLAQSFNELLDRLDKSFDQQHRFMADASHELRTPVAILRGEAEVSLSREARSQEEYRESLSIVRTEAGRLSKIVEDLFTLARADAGQHPLVKREFYLDELVAEAVRSARALAAEREIALVCETPQECRFLGDEGLLRRMVMNLVSNAIKYTPRGGRVTVTCRVAGDRYEMTVMDSGPGIPVELQGCIFDRFFRVDTARSREDGDKGGAGLGLSIARWIAEAHCGSLELKRSDSTGSVFSTFLPLFRG
jgi:two-component system, OmpR family, sensor kinase